VEWTNSFNLSTVKTEGDSPNETHAVLSVLLVNSACAPHIGMEQWQLSFLPTTPPDHRVTSSDSHVTPKVTFRRLCILFRSLESLLCFLPCYPLVRRSHCLQYLSIFQ